MTDSSRKRAVESYRVRLAESGMARFEVLGKSDDRDLIRSLARLLAKDDPEAARLRAIVGREVAGPRARAGGILDALRRSPLVGEDIAPERSGETGREIDL